MSFRQILNSPIFLVFMVTLAGAATVWCYIARQEGWNRIEKQQRIETDVKTSIEKKHEKVQIQITFRTKLKVMMD